jgi:proprotein convertase subtilisin/kexin type 5
VDPDTLFYSATFNYNKDAVAVIVFEYLEFSFRIWDYYENFYLNNSILSIRCSVYNPLYIMPSQSSINFELNLPPQNCLLALRGS